MALLVLFVVLLFPISGVAQTPAPAPPAASREQVITLMELQGSKALMGQMVEQMLATQVEGMKKLRPDIPADFWNEFTAEMRRQLRVEELLDQMVPIYQRHFSRDDLEQLIAFYRSPVGRKFFSELPLIQREAMQVGQQWGAAIGQRIGEESEQRIKEKGYKLGPPAQPPQK